MENKFNFFIPAILEKAKNKDDEEIMMIKGVASTADKDSDEEVLEPGGYDLSFFNTYGMFNWHHQAKNNPSMIIGEPTKAKIIKNQLYVEGILYKGNSVAEGVWDLGKTLERNNSKRRLGFSIEGIPIERDPLDNKRITKAKITHIAITPTPKNSNTWLGIMKGECEDDYCRVDIGCPDLIKEEKISDEFIIDIIKGDTRYTVDKEFNVEKTLTTEAGSGKDLTLEDLDGEEHRVEDKDFKKSVLAIYKAIKSGAIPKEKINCVKGKINQFTRVIENEKTLWVKKM